MGLRKWWNMWQIRHGFTEVTAYGKCFYQYCKNIVDGKDVYIESYEHDLMTMWRGDPPITRIESAQAFVDYMERNYDMEEV